MKLEWIYHTGFVVSDMDRSLAFYRDLLGMEVERELAIEGEFFEQVHGYPNTKGRLVFLGLGDGRHSLQLIQYVSPAGGRVAPVERNSVGATHLGVIVDDAESAYADLSARGVKFVNPPAFTEATPWDLRACYFQDPDGNWIELVERVPSRPASSTTLLER